ncbi:hypothetical protein JG687_00001845 [Phytophthora cactorum]|uniref:Uncharacterized protein n=2 Tax=Phytophthora cactorum TaxID=29920 RepID=A0A8T1UYW6_9STRA|nr:hypothetical protein PC123_g20350 [Phytophthora cactorum]KAG6971792.1 hypothetical protein JG687_00001845 [Phytophthora cactorum]
MIPNLASEAVLHPADRAERVTSGQRHSAVTLTAGHICDLANPYAALRRTSVKAVVSLSHWVRTAQLKGIAMHAREHHFVLEVMPDEVARAQLYAYANEKLASKKQVESGTVTALQTKEVIQLLRVLVGHGILPLVLVLHWKSQGNHI